MILAKQNIPFPSLPENFKNMIVERALDQTAPDITRICGKGEFRVKMVSELDQWLRTHVCDDFYSAGAQTIEFGDFEPHIDNYGRNGILRYFTLLYVIETGGESYTKFYESPPDLMMEFTNENGDICQKHGFERNQIKEVARYQFKKNTWNLINNQCIHSVDGITDKRICLCLNFIVPRPVSLSRLGLI